MPLCIAPQDMEAMHKGIALRLFVQEIYRFHRLSDGIGYTVPLQIYQNQIIYWSFLMGEREMFLVLGAILFFTITSLSVNQFCVKHSEVMMQSEFDYYAISLAQRVIEEVKTRAFDSAVAFGTSTNPPYDFTYPGSHLSNESFNWEEENKLPFNDVDDYNNLEEDISTPRGDYHISAIVYYVNEANPNVKVYYRTFYKKIEVTVSGDYLTQNIKLSHVYCYYDF